MTRRPDTIEAYIAALIEQVNALTVAVAALERRVAALEAARK